HPAALSFAHVAGLHHAHSALLGTKTAPAGRIGLVLAGPNKQSWGKRLIDGIKQVAMHHV
ncbi:MAG: hypothetical protein KZQ77_11895, partial [Candidatus Thiodiazotropha sp. (ex Notomyrtea botanica)]|nr:hypothetical protein [Candidatus Thiodiazotropha sp. (ex Notomyrtea botanica)]